jgi:glycosyltransferase involved in cell wall biosynthesis
VRRLLGDRIRPLIRRAHRVVVGNSYLANHVATAGARQIDVVPTVVDVSRYGAHASSRSEDGEFRVGWIGSPATAQYLAAAYPALTALAKTVPLRLVAVGAGALPPADFPVEVHPWSEGDEVAQIASFDVGIMPLPDAPWERGKCGYKLIQYMACGKPVVASPVGVNTAIVTEGGIAGLLATDEAGWQKCLGQLAVDRDMRRDLGATGRTKVERLYSLQVAAPTICHLLRESAGAA